MAEKGLPAPTPKPVRAKTPAQTKAKALPKQNTSKTSIPLEPRVVIQPVIPIDQQEDQDTLHPPNQPNQLPNIPPEQPEHIPNPPPNPPNPPPNLPNQPQQPPENPLGIMQLQDPPKHII